MTNYKAVAEFFEDVVCNEGRTDVQSYVGFMRINNNTAEELAKNAFGGKLIASPESAISECEKLIYVYDDNDDSFFITHATKHFNPFDDRCFAVEDACGQRALCWAVGVN